MYKLVPTKSFDKHYQKLIKRNNELGERFINIFEKLRNDPFQSSLKTHKVVSRNVGEAYSTSVTGDLRIIWHFDKETILMIILLGIDGHSGSKRVYK